MGVRQKVGGRRSAFLLSLGFIVAQGCSVADGVRRNGVERGQEVSAPGAVHELISAADRGRLQDIAAARAASFAGEGYRIGPDDLLEIRIPDLLESQSPVSRPSPGGPEGPSVAAVPVFQQGVRVNARGEISVQMLGVHRAEGLTPSELETEIARRLIAEGILRAPQVSVLVVEYRSRVVAVVGSVERPGLYPLTRPGATLADLVWAAGGPNKEAGRAVEFTPAADGSPADRSSIHLDLEGLLRPAGEDGGRMNPLARPGDVISIAPAGSVLVDGWVEKPGSYAVTRGLTVSGAVAAAGGHVFAADRHHVTVRRILAQGEDRSFVVDLDTVARGVAPDVPVTDGDVVRLPASYGRLVPWGMWVVAKEMVHVGGNVLLF
jgi:polysaccharide export outer membrane protein